ncbi:hypothetical protein DFJ77DRAFT_460165 [Powellomyces hirtus]|nr:hypothetical protein DFJ77DRAFT_460165 [Powellomyces hirtus]
MPGPSTLPTSTAAPPAAGAPAGSAQTDSGEIRLQLIPHSDVMGRPALGEVVERAFKEGMTVRIGRQVIKDGQPTVIKGQKQPQENDIWFASKVVSRNHAEMWVKDGQIYVKDIGSSSGTFLNKMRLSPSGKESRPYPLKEADLIQFGIDYKGKPDDIYKSIMVRIGFYDQSWVQNQRRKANPVRFRTALKMLLAAANPFASVNNDQADDESAGTDCCICIGAIGPFQALFVAPCSHCYHYKCVHSLLAQSAMFQCPMCRQVANLAASVSTDDLFENASAADSGASAEGISRQMGQLRGEGEGENTQETNAETTLSGPLANPLARLVLERQQQSSPSGDVTPRNNERSTTPALPSADSDSTSSVRSPVDRLRPMSEGPGSGATTPEHGNSTPTARRHKRRSSSLTSKLNALLRRGDKSNRESEDTSPLSPTSLMREEAAASSSSAANAANAAQEPMPDTEDDSEPTSPVADVRAPKQNMASGEGVALNADSDDVSVIED